MIRRSLACLAVAVAVAGPAAAAPAAPRPPRMAIASFTQLQTPLPYPYDEAADADAAVAKARAMAKTSGRRLIIDLGGNWCGDCRILSATMARPELKAFLDRHYVIVAVDVGRMDRNLQIPARYGITERLAGVPALLVIEPRSDRLLDADQISALSDARNMTPQALADWLARWVGADRPTAGN